MREGVTAGKALTATLHASLYHQIEHLPPYPEEAVTKKATSSPCPGRTKVNDDEISVEVRGVSY